MDDTEDIQFVKIELKWLKDGFLEDGASSSVFPNIRGHHILL